MHIDTYKLYRELMASGVPEAQAEAHIKSMDISVFIDDLVTKNDIYIFHKELIREVKTIVFIGVAAALIMPAIIKLVTLLILKLTGNL
ncbi:MAG TPA: hypothetical protein ACFYEC_03740 [Candidatus Brocadiaceae bacterium]